MSIRYKIAILFALLSGLILSSVAFTVYFFSVKERSDFFKVRLKNRAVSTAQIAAGIVDSNYTVISKLDTASIASFYDKSVTILNYRNNPLYLYADKKGNEITLTTEEVEQVKVNDTYYFKKGNRTIAGIQYISENNNFITLIAASDIDGELYLKDLSELLLLSTVLATLFSFLVGLLFARTLVNPIRKIIADVNLISTNSLSKRINRGRSKDELYSLSQTFNDLLNRLEESFIIQRRFVSNASHELSTPLTSVSSQLEVTLQKERTAEEYKEVLKSIREDIANLHLLTRSLLDIAKTGTEGSMELDSIRLDEILLKAAADIQKLNSSYDVSINFDTLPENESALTVFGNSNLLYIVFKNVIENGCKYSSNHTCMVKVYFKPPIITIEVQSFGELIPQEEINFVFQPFFRSETVQHKQGFGLGLTLVKRILALHKSTISADSNMQNGTVFTITIPSLAKN